MTTEVGNVLIVDDDQPYWCAVYDVHPPCLVWVGKWSEVTTRRFSVELGNPDDIIHAGSALMSRTS